MRIALTGATGFIGARLAARLAAAGHPLSLLSRSGRGPDLPGTTLVRGDLGDVRALGRLVAGADAAIHLAAVVRGASAADFDGPNVTGTRNLLDALDRHAPNAPLLHVSSLAAREPGLSFYAASKCAAEREVTARRAGRPTLVLRPPAVYGPGDTEMLPVFRFMARTGLAPCAGAATQRLSLIHVDDLVEAVLAWRDVAARTSATLCVHDGTVGGYDWRSLAGAAQRVCGRRVRVWEIPRIALDAAARFNLLLARLGGRSPMLTPGKLRELRHPDWVCADCAAGVLSGWTPRIDLEAGLRLTPGWC
jgi:nucleoside-diphosphate-sugar epimerase